MKSRIAAVGALTGSAVLLLAGPASAHVSVQPEDVEKGGYSKLVFKVPNERDNAGTTKLEVNLPTDHPLASVQTMPVPGWEVKVTKSRLSRPLEVHGRQITEAVTKITWSGGTIEPGTFQEFPISVGPLPEDADRLVFKTLQTYEGGEVVRWIEDLREDGSESEHPAPVVELTEPEDDAHGPGDDAKDQTSAKGSGQSDGDTAAAENASAASDSTARTLGIAGIVVGVIGTIIGVLGMRRGSGSSPGTP